MNLEIRKAEISDIKQIKMLMESIFGPFGKLEELFAKWIAQDQFSVYVAMMGNKLVGVCTWYLKTDNEYSKYALFGADAISYMKDKKSVWVLNLAISPEHRKKGVGAALSVAQVAWLKNIEKR